ncbi:MAG TPA: TetR family transcriptional regulator [Candidatus Dormibacteraeota bacterium]|nr:TetR family transcriptional regulator [Candidatus Dormibacteraeota bacterium]
MRRIRPTQKLPVASTRDPERSQRRIFEAAFREFSAKGFAGARVDVIARRAGINKRMLYHYFGNKEGLFREVLRRKMAQRQAWGIATPDEASKSLPYWFDLAFKDPNWIRLLEWEALQFAGREMIDQQKRAQSATAAVGRIRARQRAGHLSQRFDSAEVLLAMTALTWFPVAFPQLTRLITGKSVAGFRARYRQFLSEFAGAFQHDLVLAKAAGNGHSKS